MNKNIIHHGFVLILLALLSGMFIPIMPIPRLGLSAHTIGILSGVLLIALGAVWSLFVLTARQQKLLYGSWLYSSYVNWLACLLGAVVGAGQATPVAAAGAVGPAAAEAVVGVLLISVAVASFVAIGLSIFGLKDHSDQATV